MNTCPVFRRSGGHSYRATVPGPIGSVLSPTRDANSYKSLPYACSLCGSCTDVCPVKIPLHHQLLAWRGELVGKRLLPWTKRQSMRMASMLFRSPRLFSTAGRVGRWSLRVFPRWMTHNRLNKWTVARELPEPPKQSFREWHSKNRSRVVAPASAGNGHTANVENHTSAGVADEQPGGAS